jgi:5,10-methylenetetrahydrofolate reductase
MNNDKTANTPSKLQKILEAGHLAVTSECGPPRGSDPEAITKKAEMIKDHVDAINITDNQTSVTLTTSFVCPEIIRYLETVHRVKMSLT